MFTKFLSFATIYLASVLVADEAKVLEHIKLEDNDVESEFNFTTDYIAPIQILNNLRTTDSNNNLKKVVVVTIDNETSTGVKILKVSEYNDSLLNQSTELQTSPPATHPTDPVKLEGNKSNTDNIISEQLKLIEDYYKDEVIDHHDSESEIEQTKKSTEKEVTLGSIEDFKPAYVYTFEVYGTSDECFFFDHEFLLSQVRIRFFVSTGGNLRVGLKIYEDKKLLKSLDETAEATSMFIADKNVTYAVCVLNFEKSTKMVTLALNLDADDRNNDLKKPAKESHLHHLRESIREMKSLLEEMEKEQEFLKMRMTAHLLLQDSTEWRTLYYTIFETIFMLAVSFAQVFFLQSLIK